jgi:hypothetical protein
MHWSIYFSLPVEWVSTMRLTIPPKLPFTAGIFSRQDFTYDQAKDVRFCPGGKMLTTTGTLVNDDATMLYRASKHDCAGCPLKLRCCPKSPVRKVPRSIHEGARDMARAIARSEQGRRSRRLRKKIETLFGLDDLALTARVVALAAERSISAGECAMQSVGQFGNGASDEEWLTLIGLMSRTDNPGQVFLRRVLSNALPHPQGA